MSANAVVVLIGKKGTGKTSLLRTLVAPARRALIADVEAKWECGPGDEEVRGAEALLARVKPLAADSAAPFRLVYRDDAPRLALTAPGVAFVLKSCTLVVDELAWLCDSRRPLPPYLARILQFGRERRVNLLGTTREPQEIPDLFFPTADLLYFFRVDPGNGLDRIRRRYRALAAELPTLEPFTYRTYGDPTVLRLIGREGLALPRARKAAPRRR